jgi:large subunit ribosomal protein L30
MAKRLTIKIRQIGSATRRRFDQRQNLIGLGLSRIGRVAEVPDTPQTRGMIARVRHLIEVIEPQGDKS